MSITGLSLSLSLSRAADNCGLSKSCLSSWMKDLSLLREKCEIPGVRLTSHNGHVSQLEPVHNELLSFIEEYCCMGFSVSKKMLLFQASNMTGARHQAISHWMARGGLVIRAGTHQAQEAPEVTMSAAMDFIHNIARPAVSLMYHDKRYIINMDQTPVFFSMHATCTVEKKGSKTVHIRIAKNGSQRVTIAVCFTSA